MRDGQDGSETEIVIGSRNAGKLREIEAILSGLPVRLRSLVEFPDAPEVEETGSTFRENAELKALTLSSDLSRWVLADDSGLEVDALDGEPGIFSARYAGEHGDDKASNQKLLAKLESVPPEQRGAQFRCVIALAAPGRVLLTVEGSCRGTVGFEPRGSLGFGYDPLFVYPPEGKTFGELAPQIKNRISHRGAALQKLRARLGGVLEAESGAGGC